MKGLSQTFRGLAGGRTRFVPGPRTVLPGVQADRPGCRLGRSARSTPLRHARSCAARVVRGGIDPDGQAWWAGHMAEVAGFVGRERELFRLRAALGGDTRMVLVVGDAGVGKTRFTEEGTRRAVAGGLVSVWGRCLPLAEKLPLLPVAEALGELIRLNGGGLAEAALATAPSYVRVEAARLLPRLGPAGIETVKRGGERGEGWRRERLFSAVAELLGAMAGGSGLALVIEDVHWADSATLDCLTY